MFSEIRQSIRNTAGGNLLEQFLGRRLRNDRHKLFIAVMIAVMAKYFEKHFTIRPVSATFVLLHQLIRSSAETASERDSFEP